jgi:hypothetical protein
VEATKQKEEERENPSNRKPEQQEVRINGFFISS